MEISIKDDGKGFEPIRLSTKNGAGLNNMKTRSRILNGDIDVESKPGVGTKVLISIPY
jgi:signal transduction histidine kinase